MNNGNNIQNNQNAEFISAIRNKDFTTVFNLISKPGLDINCAQPEAHRTRWDSSDQDPIPPQDITPLIEATTRERFDVVALLLGQIDIKVDATWRGKTAEQWAEGKIKTLFDAHAKGYSKSWFIEEAKNASQPITFFKAIRNADLVKTTSLLSNGTNINIIAENNTSALVLCAAGRILGIGLAFTPILSGMNMAFIENNLTTFKKKSSIDKTPFLDERFIPVANALLDKGIDVNARTHDGLTALILAAAVGDIQFISLLMSKRPHDLNMSLRDNETSRNAKEWAERCGHTSVVSIIETYEDFAKNTTHVETPVRLSGSSASTSQPGQRNNSSLEPS
jgi:hypothetical protein